MRLMWLLFPTKYSEAARRHRSAVQCSGEQRPLCRCRRSQVQKNHILVAQVSFLKERQLLRRVKDFPLQEKKCRRCVIVHQVVKYLLRALIGKVKPKPEAEAALCYWGCSCYIPALISKNRTGQPLALVWAPAKGVNGAVGHSGVTSLEGVFLAKPGLQ